MVFLDQRLTELCVNAAEKFFGAAPGPDLLPLLRAVPASKEEHGDYQCNAALTLAKQLKKPPREIADGIKANLDTASLTAEVAGAGFVNLRLKPEFCWQTLCQQRTEPKLGIPLPETRQTIVLDFSAPNVAKPMHIGHIRSTIIGDCLQRVFRELGHEVISDNHIGDWGTQFGKLLYALKHFASPDILRDDPMQKLLDIYVDFDRREKDDPSLTEKAKQELVKLQNGDPENTAIWKRLIELSLKEWSGIYNRLGIHFDRALGESFYQPMLAGVVDDLLKQGTAVIDDGAACIFFPEVSKLAPFIIRKQDGGFLYATTDIATISYRLREFNPGRILYVTDDRQSLHFQQLFYVARHFLKAEVSLDHIPFGLVRLPEGHLSSREGRVIPLTTLLDEAKDRAYRLISEKRGDLDEAHKQLVAETVGIGAVKYNDLSQSRESVVVFEWDTMLAFDGNTAPYLQYTCARIRSIFDKGEIAVDSLSAASLPDGVTPFDQKLMKLLLRYPENVRNVTNRYYPHLLCEYLYALANSFHRFYLENPVLKAEPALREFRLLLCSMTQKVMTRGLYLLGINTVHPM